MRQNNSGCQVGVVPNRKLGAISILSFSIFCVTVAWIQLRVPGIHRFRRIAASVEPHLSSPPVSEGFRIEVAFSGTVSV